MLEIKAIQDSDIPQVVTIYNYYILNSTVTFEITPHSKESFQKRVDSLKGKYPFLVAKDGEKVLGYAYLAPFSEREAYSISADFSIYIDKDHLGKHLGKVLFQKIVEWAKAHQIEAIISIITDENTASMAFHEHLGFTLAGHLEKIARKMNKDLGVYYYKFKVTK